MKYDRRHEVGIEWANKDRVCLCNVQRLQMTYSLLKIENMFRSQCSTLGPILHYYMQWIRCIFCDKTPLPWQTSDHNSNKRKASRFLKVPQYHILKAENFDLFRQLESVEKRTPGFDYFLRKQDQISLVYLTIFQHQNLHKTPAS